MLVQMYSEGNLSVFPDGNHSAIFTISGITYRELDMLGLPRLGKPKGKPWKQTSWGWEIEVDFQTKVRSNTASSRRVAVPGGASEIYSPSAVSGRCGHPRVKRGNRIWRCQYCPDPAYTLLVLGDAA